MSNVQSINSRQSVNGGALQYIIRKLLLTSFAVCSLKWDMKFFKLQRIQTHNYFGGIRGLELMQRAFATIKNCLQI